MSSNRNITSIGMQSLYMFLSLLAVNNNSLLFYIATFCGVWNNLCSFVKTVYAIMRAIRQTDSSDVRSFDTAVLHTWRPIWHVILQCFRQLLWHNCHHFWQAGRYMRFHRCHQFLPPGKVALLVPPLLITRSDPTNHCVNYCADSPQGSCHQTIHIVTDLH